MASFKVAELAFRLEVPDNRDLALDPADDFGFRLVIDCGVISAVRPLDCSGTHPDFLMQGRVLDVAENLRALKDKLREVLEALEAAPVPPGGERART